MVVRREIAIVVMGGRRDFDDGDGLCCSVHCGGTGLGFVSS
jgi:hypothetical protein